MKNNAVIAAVALILIIIAAGAFFLFKGKGLPLPTQDSTGSARGINKDPIDIVSDFYASWLDAAKSTSTDPYKEGLQSNPALSSALSAKLAAAKGTSTDPVLCQSRTPSKIATRVVYTLPAKEEILVTAKDKDLTGQAIVTLSKQGENWSIDSIECAAGEFAPEREFTFEQEGFLLKQVPPPYDPKNWHLVFSEEGTMGHVVPLFFDSSSMCTSPDGTTAVCDPSTFKETRKATVHGNMTEYGVNVKKMELTNDEFQAKS